MKKKLLLLALIVLPMLAEAQIAAMVHRYADVFYPGIVTMKSGRSTEYAQVELPKYDQAEITVSKDPKRKQTSVLKSEDIAYVTIWSKDFPEIKNTLYHISADRDCKGKKFQDYWGYPIAGSSWGMVFQCHLTYTMDKETGHLQGDYYGTYNNGIYQENPVACVLIRPGQKHGHMVILAQSSGLKMWNVLHQKDIAELFAANPEIKEGVLQKKGGSKMEKGVVIKAGGLRGDDIQYVLDEMAASSEKHSDALPEISGTPGDDE